MAAPVIQTSFSTGEWAPALNARIDLAKYHSAAALLENFFVDYRGGASTRPGTKFIAGVYNSETHVRLVSFQASTDVGYIIEFGHFYIRVIFDSSLVVGDPVNITAATQADPCVITAAGHGCNPNDWIYIENVVGMTPLNNKYFNIGAVAGDDLSLRNPLNLANINSTGYPAYSAGGTLKKVLLISSPYSGDDVANLKFAQNVNTLIINHPDYVPYALTLISAANWTLLPIIIGTTVSTPTGTAATTTLAAGSVNYSYIVTAVDINGQESAPSAAATLTSKQDLRTTAGTNQITWNTVSGAISYNVYKAELSYAGAVAGGAAHGYIGFTTGTTFDDSNIVADFSETPPIARNPFQGASVISITVGTVGTYTSVPVVTLTAAPAGGVTATANAVLQVQGTPAIVGNSVITPNQVGDIFQFSNGVRAVVASIAGGTTNVTAFQPITYPGSNPGSITSGATPTNPVTGVNTRTGTTTCTADLTWGVGRVNLISGGAGYITTPTVTFSAGLAAATATLGPSSAGNPSVPAFFQQRLTMGGAVRAPQTFNMSQPGSFYNYNVTNPIQPDDAISAQIVSAQLNTIKSMVPMSSGLIILSDRAAWQIYGASPGAPVSAVDTTAQSQSFSGASDVPPIVVNYDILYVQAKGSSVRNLTYNFNANIYTGTDISVLSSHLFFGYTITEWAWAEEPFKLVWAVRDDGVLLSLTYLKEQEVIGWTHHVTDGEFKSIASVVEEVDGTLVDAVYLVVERGGIKLIERMAERFFTNYIDPWCVDSGLRYEGAPTLSLTGGEHLAGVTCTGLADGIPITPFVMPADGNFLLAAPASFVTVGRAFLPRLQTLAIDTGNPTIQSKEKAIPVVTLRVEKTLGLTMGATFATQVAMKDLVRGNVGSMTNAVVTDLVTGDARTFIDTTYTVQGQYCIEQPTPYPATILGVIPWLTIGDTGGGKR